MTTQTTEPTEQTAQPVQLRNYMAALSALEQMLSVSPVLPHSATVYVPGFAPDKPNLDLHCGSAADVEEFGRFFDAYVTSRPHRDEPGSDIYTAAEGEFLGIPFRAWILTSAQASAVAA